jgi:hypothetical protein
LSQDVIGDALGLSLAYVNRVLRRLADDGLVFIKDQKVVQPNDLNFFAACGRHAISKTVGLKNSGGKRSEEVALVRSRRSRPAILLSLTPRGVWVVAEAFGSTWKQTSGRRPRGLLSAVVVNSTMPPLAFDSFSCKDYRDEHESARLHPGYQ